MRIRRQTVIPAKAGTHLAACSLMRFIGSRVAGFALARDDECGKMRQFGKVDIPQEAFIAVLKMDEN
jgi:hypothetical protein